MSATADTPAGRTRLRDSQEFQSALVRFPLGFAALIFLIVGHFTGQFPVRWFDAIVLYGIHLVVFLVLLAWVVARPAFHQWRSDLSILMDLSATTSLLWLSGDPLSPLFLIYIVLFISQGTRHGRRNLTVAAAGSIVCFTAIVAIMGGWDTRPVQAAFVLGALLVLPLYQYRLLRNLQESRHRAEAATRARGDFLATMSHELRTPLSGIVGTARLLDSTPLDHEQRRCVESIRSSADTLQVLIGDILDLSRIDSGHVDLHPDYFDLRRSVLDVCRNVGQDALEKGVELVCCIDGPLPQQVYGDRVRFEQILYNLVGNAVKFTPAGRICVEVERAAPHPDLPREHVEVVIGDTGVGIPRERLDSIFERFWQADTRSSRQCGGTGLGTTIARRLTLAMEGHITADSAEGQGTTFRVRLPLLPDAAHDRPPQPPAALRGRTALIHECDPEARSSLEESCRQAGMHVAACSDDGELDRRIGELGGAEAVDVLVIADTPAGVDLDAVAAHLHERLGRAPPTLYVGYACRLVQPRSASGPAIGKPWHPDELWGALARQLDPDAGHDGTARVGTPLPAPDPARADTRILVVEDDPVNAGLVETLLARLGFGVTVARGPQEAFERLDEEDFDLLLVDLRMPGMDGFEFTRRVRARENEGPRTPIVALTASPEAEVRQQGMAAGMDGFLTKPIDVATLESLVARFAD